MNQLVRITILGLMGNSVFLRIPHFHNIGETLSASSLYMEPGGKGCNQAVAAARLGAQVNFLSCMGEDSIAKDCLAFMNSEGIVCYTEYVKDKASPYACILTDTSGDNQVTVYNGSARYMSRAFVESCEKVIATSDILLLNNECPLEVNLTALDIALRYEVTSVLNPAPYLPLSQEVLSNFSIVTPNRFEAAMLCGLPIDSNVELLLEGLLDLGIHHPVITLGGDGAMVWNGEKPILIPSHQVAVQDTTGAGDCFNGALCCAIAEGFSLEDAVAFATKAASFSVSKRFVMPSLPYRRELTVLD